MVKRIRINTTVDEKERSNPFRFPNIGVEKFLELNSEQNHDDYCLAYVFTDRDFDDGVLGLAWVGAPSGSSGGICERSKLYSDGKRKSLNTGIITVQNYASHVPPKVSHITFAHEVGHNFGSPHDSGLECTPGEAKLQDKKERGNYIMYARATSGDKTNNNKFSICSIRNITQVLEKKRGSCFVESGQPICGNGLVEAGEQCDCGYSDQCKDECCFDANQAEGTKCKLKPGAFCSPSQGPCCTRQCSFMGISAKCRNDSECAHQGNCNGLTAQCPTSAPKENFTICHSETQVCINGVCSGSICSKYNLDVCTCAPEEGKDEMAELCHVCCMEKNKPETCKSTGSEKWVRFFQSKVITLQPGSPCNDFKGYCDVFMKCRLVDADGPLARLKKAIFNPELYENIAEWIVAYWWAVLLMGIALIMLMAGFIKICSVHTPSSNPKLPPPKPLPGTLKRRRPQHAQAQTQPQRHQRQQRESYQMGQMRR
ncbi:disintegrin and metalloproteinase domain-containing protein 10-like [Sardina pilchardus]|uniref:disintegrin and metalloproteinase domain-containing protein 10-like n=1 Tax=Sardina pilchardus TaxID=27697 RepID=UPI002E0FD878